MNILVPITLYAWPFVVLLLFALMPARRAVIAAFLIAWLFLPMATIQFQGWPNYGKVTATSYAVMLGVLLFDGGRFLRLRWSWADVPMIAWCLVPIASCMSNNIGGNVLANLYGGVGLAFTHTVTWGVPWLIGRLYFSDLEGLRELAIGVVIGGAVYVPFCLFEVRMAPVLHLLVYGEHQHAFNQHVRSSGYRPMVFMQHGLAVSMWMASASLTAFWLWYSGAIRRFWGVPTSWVSIVIAGTAVLCKSLGALVLLAIGVGALLGSAGLRSRVLLAVILLMPPAYIVARVSGGWAGEWLVSAAEVINEERARSLEGRMWNEDLYIQNAMSRPVLGLTPWNFQVYDQYGEQLTTSDGLWIIAFSQYGAVGVFGVFGALLFPMVRLLRGCTAAQLMSPVMAPAVVLGLVVVAFVADSLFNAMVNPIFAAAAGGLAVLPLSQTVQQYLNADEMNEGPRWCSEISRRLV